MRHQPTVLDPVLQQHLPWGVFDRLMAEHEGDARCRGFRSRDHLIALLAAALGGHHGLRQAVAALTPNRGPLGLAGAQAPARSTLSDASRQRPAALFTAFLQALLPSITARAPRRDLREAVRLIDATQLDLGRCMIGWLGLHRGQVAAKLHLVFDLRAERPVPFEVTPARVNDITATTLLTVIRSHLFSRNPSPICSAPSHQTSHHPIPNSASSNTKPDPDSSGLRRP